MSADKVFERTENGVTTTLTIKEAMPEMNFAMMEGKRHVREMSSGRTRTVIHYKDGRTVRFDLVDATAKEPAPEGYTQGQAVVVQRPGRDPFTGTVAHTHTAPGYVAVFDDRSRTVSNYPTRFVSAVETEEPAETDGKGRRIVAVKGKRYIVSAITPARPRTEGAVSWIPEAYVSYWSERNGETFGATRFANASAKPGTVGRAIWDAVNA